MIDSHIIEWLDFGDTTQKIDVYTGSNIKNIRLFFRELTKNKNFPSIEIIFMILFFIQLISISTIIINPDKDFILEIFYYIKNFILIFEIITNSIIY